MPANAPPDIFPVIKTLLSLVLSPLTQFLLFIQELNFSALLAEIQFEFNSLIVGIYYVIMVKLNISFYLKVNLSSEINAA